MKQLLIIFTLLSFWSSALAQNPDINLLKDINLNRNRSLDPTFRFITNSVTPVSIAAPAGYITIAFIKKDSASKSNAILVCGSFLVDAVFSTGLKYAVNRHRPFDTYPFIDKETSGGSPSFPSGHTSSAFAIATSISITCPKWYIITPAFLWAGAVGYSRMDLGVHYPSDVLAGALIGTGSAYLTYKLQQWIHKKW